MNLFPKSASGADASLKLAFLYMKGRAARLADVEGGAAPTEFFYGAIELAKQGHAVAHFEIDPDFPAGWTERIVGRIWPASARPVKMEAATITQVFRLARKLNRADCLIATGGNIAFALAALARIGVIQKPIVGIQCGVLHFRHGMVRRRISASLLRRMHTQLFGDAELEPMRRFFDLPAEAISVNLFGVDTRFWRPDAAIPRDLVLAIGNDSRRDFQTLIAAAPEIPAPVHIVTKLPLPATLPANATHHRGSWHGVGLSDEGIRALYQRARAVVVPLHPSNQPSGQSVALQAMACGCPVIVTETEGLWSRTQMLHEENVLLVPPGDSAQLAAGVRRILGDLPLAERLSRAGRRTTEQTGNIDAFAANIGNCCARLVSERRISRKSSSSC